ncbi:MAG: hypothetical protein JW827_09615 [Spirochaetes bacterium]|nr:hypothetical protein [Spirochaetota bacterium]
MKIILIFLLVLANINLTSGESLLKDHHFFLNVIYLEDERLPSIPEKDINIILNEARDELRLKFGAIYIHFDYKGKQDLKSFFDTYLNKGSDYYNNLSNYKYKFFSGSIDYSPFKKPILKFLKQWKLWDLKDFFDKETKKKIKTYDDVMEYLFKGYAEKLNKLESLKLENGEYLIDRENNNHNSYINWLVAMYFQDLYDIIITNTIIVYDDISKPYPHAVLRYAKVGGSSFESPNRVIFDGTSGMVNLFEMLTDISYFQKPYQEKELNKNDWNGIIGRYIMAHELAHMIYLIPDVYDHPKQCLMDSSYATMDYYEGYKLLKKYPFECPLCKPYANAREHHLLADDLFKKEDYEEAILHYKLAKKMTPNKLDIPYSGYISLLDYKIAHTFYKLDDKKSALLYLKNALKNDPNNEKAKQLYEQIK